MTAVVMKKRGGKMRAVDRTIAGKRLKDATPLGVTYGLNGWYWKMANGRLGVIHGANETLSYVEPSEEAEVCKLLQVDLGLQKELRSYHDSKGGRSPKTAPLTPRRYTGKLRLKRAV